jgi:hypothetical protein
VLFQANIKLWYNVISESTIGIIFLGTPYCKSEKAMYRKVLATIAITVLHTLALRLINALQANSKALMQLTMNFRF